MRVLTILLSILAIAFTQPASFNVTVNNLQPEGIEYSATTGFLLGSVFQGQVYSVNDNGVATLWSGTSNLISAIGLHVDSTRGLLHVANANFSSIAKIFGGDFSGPFYSGLVTFNLTTGAQIRSINLANTISFANDLTVDGVGNVYVTDAIGGKIWVVSPAGNVTVLTNIGFSGGGGVGINGIDYHPNGYVITVNSGTGKLYKIAGTVVTEVTLTGNVTSGDGINFNSNNDLVVVKNSFFQAVLVRSTDNWVTANVVETVQLSTNGVPTTAALRGGSAYVVHTAFAPPFPASYLVEKVTFTTPTQQSSSQRTATSQQTATSQSSQSGTNSDANSSFGLIAIPSFLLALFMMYL